MYILDCVVSIFHFHYMYVRMYAEMTCTHWLLQVTLRNMVCVHVPLTNRGGSSLYIVENERGREIGVLCMVQVYH